MESLESNQQLFDRNSYDDEEDIFIPFTCLDTNHIDNDVNNMDDSKDENSMADATENEPDDEGSFEEQPKWSQPMFVLNRNGKSERELKDIFEEVTRREFDDDTIEATWISVFGRGDQPHCFVVLNNDRATTWLIDEGVIDHDDLIYDITIAQGIEPKIGEEETCKLHFNGVPGRQGEEEEIEEDLREFFYPIAEVKTVIFSRNWASRGEVFVEFYDQKSASFVLRVAGKCKFHDSFMKGSFARVQKLRNTPSPEPLTNSRGNIRDSPKKFNKSIDGGTRSLEFND